MKVLFYNHTAQVSGAERVLLLLLARLNHRTFARVVICPADGPLKEMVGELSVPCYEVDGLKARFTWRIDHLVRYLASFWRLISQVRAHVRRVNPDLIHANSVRAGLVATAATIGLRKPVIWHVHDMLPRHPLSTAIRLVVLCSARTRVIAISRAVAERFRGYLPRSSKAGASMAVIHNAVDLEKFYPDTTSRQTTRADLQLSRTDQAIGIIGQVTPRKGQLELLQAFALVLRQLPQAKLIIVGAPLFNRDEEYFRCLTEFAQTQGVAEQVRFLGAREDIRAITCALDLLVVNSLVEPFGLVVLEAMACGTPVLATAVDGIPEIIRHDEDGWLIPSGDNSALASAMVDLINRPQLRAKLSAAGLEKVRSNFTVEKYVAAVEEFYAESCGKQSVRRVEHLIVGST